jgi:hypothetical protein
MDHSACGPFRIVRVEELAPDWRGRRQYQTVTCDGAGCYVTYIDYQPLDVDDVNNTALVRFLESHEPASQLS